MFVVIQKCHLVIMISPSFSRICFSHLGSQQQLGAASKHSQAQRCIARKPRVSERSGVKASERSGAEPMCGVSERREGSGAARARLPMIGQVIPEIPLVGTPRKQADPDPDPHGGQDLVVPHLDLDHHIRFRRTSLDRSKWRRPPPSHLVSARLQKGRSSVCSRMALTMQLTR